MQRPTDRAQWRPVPYGPYRKGQRRINTQGRSRRTAALVAAWIAALLVTPACRIDDGTSVRRESEVPASESGPAGDNLLKNPSFEAIGTEGLPENWSANLAPRTVGDRGRAHTGTTAFAMTGASSLSQAVPVTPGTTYVVGHYTMSDATGQSARLQVNFVNERAEIEDVKIEVVPVGSKWTWHQMEVAAPAGAAAAIVYASPHEQGSVWFDDLWFAVSPR